MNTQLVPFQFESHSIRVVTHDDGSWSVVAKDVAEALGYSESSNAARLFAHVPDEWKGVNPIHTLGGTQEMLTITESGLYFFLGRSDKAKALPFQKWIAGDVIPSIRETGSYSIHHAKPAANELPIKDAMSWFSSFSAFAKNELGLKDNFAKLSANICTFKMVGVDVLDFFGQTHLIANPKGLTYNPTELGELLNPPRSAKWVNKSIAIAGLQTNENVHWIPTEKAEGLYEWTDTGKRHHDGTAVKQLRWFKGVLDFVIAPEEAAKQTQAA